MLLTGEWFVFIITSILWNTCIIIILYYYYLCYLSEIRNFFYHSAFYTPLWSFLPLYYWYFHKTTAPYKIPCSLHQMFSLTIFARCVKHCHIILIYPEKLTVNLKFLFSSKFSNIYYWHPIINLFLVLECQLFNLAKDHYSRFIPWCGEGTCYLKSYTSRKFRET